VTVDIIPLEVLLGNPERVQPQLSPDGRRMAYIAPVAAPERSGDANGVLNVLVGEIGKDDYQPVTHDTDRGVQGYAWCFDNKHLLYVQDQAGDENWRIYTVDLDTGEIVDRTPFDGVQAQIIARRRRFPNELLIGLNKDNPQLHDVYHLDLTTGELTKRVENPGFLAWVVDEELKVRGGVAPQPDGGFMVVVRDTEESDWRPLVTFPSDDAIASSPIGFTADGSGLYMTSSLDANAARLVKMDITTGAVEVLAEDATYDVVGASINPDTRVPELAFFLKEKLEYVVLDPSIQADMDALRNVQEGDFGLVDRSLTDDTWIVAFDVDDGPVRYYSFDRRTKEATFLFDHKSQLNAYPLVPMEPFSYKARDGLEVHGYLSFPAETPRTNLPTVINVHGGPWFRDSWGFNPEAQWLANRGYLCVQVNFRGSIGYGKDFVNAGDKEWGGKMQDDISDVVGWVIDQGYADADRICIYGGSYGGYAALVGATFTPELYRCAVALCGPSNLKSFIEGVPPYWAPMIAMLHKRVGNPDTEEEFLWSRSPLSKVDNISIPLFIGHGANDPRVKLSETEQIVEAMKSKGIPYELLVKDDEGHGFVKPENRLDYYRKCERFLATHLGGRTE
jgi:dipeptidyl aminopeptidase/acylaminoacyl peptidase